MGPFISVLQNRVVVALALAVFLRTDARPQAIAEYEVKAAFLFNFVKFVEWPPQAFKTPTDPILICVLGQNTFGAAIEEAIKGKAVDGRTLLVRRLADDEPALSCQILFVHSTQKKRFESIAGSIKAVPILTVGEIPGFAAGGGMINFKLDSGRVRFEINREAAQQAHLRISSKLLSLAEIIKR